jgi:hypothetical protein
MVGRAQPPATRHERSRLSRDRVRDLSRPCGQRQQLHRPMGSGPLPDLQRPRLLGRRGRRSRGASVGLAAERTLRVEGPQRVGIDPAGKPSQRGGRDADGRKGQHGCSPGDEGSAVRSSVTNDCFRHITQRHPRVNHAGLRRDPAHATQRRQRLEPLRLLSESRASILTQRHERGHARPYTSRQIRMVVVRRLG